MSDWKDVQGVKNPFMSMWAWSFAMGIHSAISSGDSTNGPGSITGSSDVQVNLTAEHKEEWTFNFLLPHVNITKMPIPEIIELIRKMFIVTCPPGMNVINPRISSALDVDMDIEFYADITLIFGIKAIISSSEQDRNERDFNNDNYITYIEAL